MRSTSSDTTEEDADFIHEVTVRVLKARDEFFLFMKDFTEDFTVQDDHYWSCLGVYFDRWLRTKMTWVGNPRDSGKDSDDPTLFKGPGTREFEAFTQLLPQILLAVIDESLRYPELLDASPVNPDGTLRRQHRRHIPYLFSTLWESERQRTHPRFEKHYDDSFALSVIEQPFPPIISTFD